ncbi:MAG: mechanosensitive ion channel [Gemmatimonadota bacterium]
MQRFILFFILAAATVPDAVHGQDGAATGTTDSTLTAPASVPRQRAERDEAIRGELQALFDRIAMLERVRARVDAGVVTLTGTVVDGEAREQAAELARDLDDVRFVDNRIEQSNSVNERLTPTWTRLRDFAQESLARLPLLLVAAAVVLLAALLGWLARRWRAPATLVSRNPFLQGLLQRLLQACFLLGGILLALDLLDATALVGAVAGTAGLAGLALSFAFKDIGENYLSGILLSLRPPFAKNDHIVLESHEGKVIRLTWRDTILMTLDGNHVRVPNARVFGSTLLNYTRNPNRRFEFDFGVGPANDLARAQALGIETLRSMSSVLGDPPPQSRVIDVGDSTVLVRWLAWVDQRATDFGRARSEAVRLVKLRLEGAGISLPSPEYLVRLRRDPSESPLPSPAGAGSHRQGDTSVDRAVEAQIEAERRHSPEDDLLSPVVRDFQS